jgi:hypothetical protein
MIQLMLAHPKVFPSILICLDCLAALAYGYNHDWRRMVYWMAAAVLTMTVTY